MNVADYGPWLIVGGYAVAIGLLVLGSNLGPRYAKLAYAASAAGASVITVYWLTLGTFSGPFVYLWALAPIAVTALLWLRKYRQSEWMDRLAGRTGRVFDQDRPGRPSFGVLPGSGSALDRDDPRTGFLTAIELDLSGHRVLGVQYTLFQGARAPGGPERSKADQVGDIAGNGYHMVELRTPIVPALVIAPRDSNERHELFGLEPSEFRPFEDARITRNTIGGLKPDADLEALNTGHLSVEFAEQFKVHTAEEAFALAVLTPEVQRHILADPWSRVRELVWHNGAFWTVDTGQLTEAGVLTHARHLARLAATVPGHAWRWSAPAPNTADTADTERFITASRAADTSVASWYRGRRSLIVTINERRIAANRVPLTPGSVVVRASLIAALTWFAIVVALFGTGDDGTAGRVAGPIVLGACALALAKVTFYPRARPIGNRSSRLMV